MSLPIGNALPELNLTNQLEDKITYESLTSRWVIVYFYPKDNTPGCTTEAIEFSQLLPEFEALDCTIIGISPDSCQTHQKFINKHQLKIMLLSDPDHTVAEQYGVWQLKKFMGKEYMGIVRSTFLVDNNRNLAYSWINVKAKGHAKTVLKYLQSL